MEVTGTVDDVRPHLDDCEVLVVPLRSGGGTRIKIFEAMAQGVPVVSTTIGAEGLPVIDGETILISDDSVNFADLTIQILSSEELGRNISTEARAVVLQNNTWGNVAEQFHFLLANLNQDRTVNHRGFVSRSFQSNSRKAAG